MQSGLFFSTLKKLPLPNSSPHSEQTDGVMISNTTIPSFFLVFLLSLLSIRASLSALLLEILPQLLPNLKILVLELRCFHREFCRADNVARFEHEGHGAF